MNSPTSFPGRPLEVLNSHTRPPWKRKHRSKMAAIEGVEILEERIKALEQRVISTNDDKIKTSVRYTDNISYLA